MTLKQWQDNCSTFKRTSQMSWALYSAKEQEFAVALELRDGYNFKQIAAKYNCGESKIKSLARKHLRRVNTMSAEYAQFHLDKQLKSRPQ